MSNVNVVTSAPDVEGTRRKNMIQYSVIMGLRLACIFVCFFIPIMWIWIPALVAVFAPIVATVTTTQQSAESSRVVLGNVGRELTR